MTKLVLNRISRFFGQHAAVDRLNLEIASGEFVSLLGPSGCGKTTTLRMIAGFLDPNEGQIEAGGELISKPRWSVPSEVRNMSMIFQSYALWPHMTVRQNVGFGLKIRRLSRSEIAMRVEEVLDLVQLGHVVDRYPGELSGGQQRVALARAIVIRPSVLLLDEPLSNLDASLREDLRKEIRRLHNELGITTVYVTHDQAEALTMSDRIAVMNMGRLEQCGDPIAIYTKPKTEFVARFIGRTNVLDGQVQGRTAVFAPYGVELALDHAMPANGTVEVSLRPHDIRLEPSGSGGPKAVIRDRVFVGDTWQYSLQCEDGSSLLADTAVSRAFCVDDQVCVRIDPKDLVVLRK